MPSDADELYDVFSMQRAKVIESMAQLEGVLRSNLLRHLPPRPGVERIVLKLPMQALIRWTHAVEDISDDEGHDLKLLAEIRNLAAHRWEKFDWIGDVEQKIRRLRGTTMYVNAVLERIPPDAPARTDLQRHEPGMVFWAAHGHFLIHLVTNLRSAD